MDLKTFLLARIEEDEKLAVTDEFSIDQEVRMFRECRTKRAIIGSHQSCTAMTGKEEEPGVKLVGAGMVQGLDLALKSLAAVYADHPDYQPEWKLAE